MKGLEVMFTIVNLRLSNNFDRTVFDSEESKKSLKYPHLT